MGKQGGDERAGGLKMAQVHVTDKATVKRLVTAHSKNVKTSIILVDDKMQAIQIAIRKKIGTSDTFVPVDFHADTSLEEIIENLQSLQEKLINAE